MYDWRTLVFGDEGSFSEEELELLESNTSDISLDVLAVFSDEIVRYRRNTHCDMYSLLVPNVQSQGSLSSESTEEEDRRRRGYGGGDSTCSSVYELMWDTSFSDEEKVEKIGPLVSDQDKRFEIWQPDDSF